MENKYTLSIDGEEAVADLTEYHNWKCARVGFLITWIQVPMSLTGQGFGSKLLKKVTAEADKEQETLFLLPSSQGDLDDEVLKKWYKDHGFQEFREMYKRIPK